MPRPRGAWRCRWPAGATLHIVPGLLCTGPDGQADVMRGEETQLWGADLADGDCCVLPGTHSKWAWTGAGGAVERFQTYMTGELYAVLVQHSILGRLMQPAQPGPRPSSRRRAPGPGRACAPHAPDLCRAHRRPDGARAAPTNCPTSCRAC
jgi:hypothetical protein